MKIILLLLLISLLASADINAQTRCRCRTDEPCWPSQADWGALNETIGGNLVAVHPVGYPCHDPGYNGGLCAVVQANTNRSSYRAAQPGAVQFQNWEAWPEQNQTCFVGSPISEPCGQGRVPLYSAAVESVDQIQLVRDFAVKHNIRLTVKNTGHDFLGRSTAPHSLQISTRKLRQMAVVDEFVPEVPSTYTGPPPAPVRAATFGAGVQLHEMYAFLGTRHAMVVGGSANTVGVAGGYIQGGGHSLMGWLHGMASDNALQFGVILPNGLEIIANPYINKDIFWALRGGGGGTFGVVVNATVRAYPDYPVIHTELTFSQPTPSTTFWKGLEVINRYILRLNNAGGSGSYVVIPLTTVAGANASIVRLSLDFFNKTKESPVQSLFRPLLNEARRETGVTPTLAIKPYSAASAMYADIYTGDDPAGSVFRVGSRLISRQFFEQSHSAAQVTTALANLTILPGNYIGGYIVGGGQVSRNKDLSTALNPVWRETFLHLGVLRRAGPDPSVSDTAIARIITDQDVPTLKTLEPGRMGAYSNEADADEPDFGESFWGVNYPRLKEIKRTFDPDGIFIVRKGVGSEEWDAEGMCRLS